ncbi:DUF2971 domain-containing protein [Aeromonas hydrophila]|uniref:DUF2971 domain-containing protein n=1 Tax=Aeromonas hydrophila TaxID=644 RepID=UPI00188FAF3A|nr:DUF2971 domain-containing protein [Aeromonas hydrophila]MBF4800255.1 DUF2971 domain-containing protein [Aeromonas hydrophila]
METLYKYYSKLGANYFDNPTIKLSNTKKLNDPFEKHLSEDLREIAIGNIYTENGELDIHKVFSGVVVPLSMSRIGIVSLTETPRSVLMWSYYANEHKGICIGYKTSYLEKNKNIQHDSFPTEWTPVKVNYDNYRYNKYTDEFNGLSDRELKKAVFKKALLTKNESWSHEKEFRSIVPLEYHDHIYHPNSDPIEFREILNKYKIIGISNQTQDTFKTENNSLAVTSIMSENDNLFFMIKINQKHISQVYFGCEMNEGEEMSIYQKISSTPNLQHIKVYKIELSTKQFELEVTPYQEYINKKYPSES